MKRIATIFLFLLVHASGFTQTADPREVTPAIENQFRAAIEKQAIKLLAELKKAGTSPLVTEFTIDTFLIEEYYAKVMKYDYTTAGMSAATYHSAAQYDSLLNKYYKRLMAALDEEDRKLLVQAQRSWIAFRDAEINLNDRVGKNGGTLEQLIDASLYFELIRQRVFTLVAYLQRVR